MTGPVSGRGRAAVGPSGEDPRPGTTPRAARASEREDAVGRTVGTGADHLGCAEAGLSHDYTVTPPELSSGQGTPPPPIPSSTSICNGPNCGLTIRWAMTEQGRRIPLDHDPDPTGNIIIVTIGGKHRARILAGPQLPAQQQAWMPHHRTCVDGADYKRRQHATRPRCPFCRDPMDRWLATVGLRGHVLCLPDAEHDHWFTQWLTGRSAA